ncbi:MAG: NADH-quinone oxidoreductase subunit A [Verrucomicrobiales bacterium]|nr:NADH-quinone oxidoreductase subunit A [Verrucomicrobiales bacterium]
MQQEFIPVLIQIVIATGFAVATLIASVLLGKRAKRNQMKDSAYECGMLPIGEGQARFSVKFYLVAMLFVLFDIEVVFLYPWAVSFKRLAVDGGQLVVFFSALSFIVILFVAYLYALRKGALEWKD